MNPSTALDRVDFAPAAAPDLMAAARRVVVKIGTETIIRDGRVDRPWLDTLATDVAALKGRGCEVVIVSSGAIALGRGRLGVAASVPTRDLDLSLRQQLSMIGQIALSSAFQDAFDRAGLLVGQGLVDSGDIADDKRRQNFRNACLTRDDNLSFVPVLNENDALITDEITFGDNDGLGGHVARVLGADVYVMLSDIDGLYRENPKTCPDPATNPLIPHVTDLQAAFRCANDNLDGFSRGGMTSKIAAASLVAAGGASTILTRGKGVPHCLDRMANGTQPATVFHPSV